MEMVTASQNSLVLVERTQSSELLEICCKFSDSEPKLTLSVPIHHSLIILEFLRILQDFEASEKGKSNGGWDATHDFCSQKEVQTKTERKRVSEVLLAHRPQLVANLSMNLKNSVVNFV